MSIQNPIIAFQLQFLVYKSGSFISRKISKVARKSSRQRRGLLKILAAIFSAQFDPEMSSFIFLSASQLAKLPFLAAGRGKAREAIYIKKTCFL